MIKNLLYIFVIIFFISSCTISKKTEKNLIKTKNSKYFSLNFNCTVENVILEMLNSKNIFFNKKTLFFVNLLNNNTNVFIDEKKLTKIIKSKISQKTKNVYFVTCKKINQDKKKIGLSNLKNSIRTDAAILLARNNHAKYYLESNIYKKNELFFLKIQLILVKTGEIIFSKIENFYL